MSRKGSDASSKVPDLTRKTRGEGRQKTNDPPRKGAEPPRKTSDQPQKTNDPPWKTSVPPRKTIDPPQKATEPLVRKTSDPPRNAAEPTPKTKEETAPRKTLETKGGRVVFHSKRPPASDFLLVCAIDFGTTFSGYAFSFKQDFERDPLQISTNNWVGHAAISQKAPSSILLDLKGKFHSFGYEAEDKFCQLAENEETEGWYFFKQFKMKLHHSNLKRNLKLTDCDGKSMQAQTIFAMCLRYIREHLLDTLNKRSLDVRPVDIAWVITVPAMWSDPAKQFMREAAIESGINDEQITLALEPEAASIYCKQLPLDRIVGGRQAVGFEPGDRYMVVDLGGGTADVTVHKVLPNGSSLVELHRASGGAWGGTKVDAAFRAFFTDIFTDPVMKEFAKENMFDEIDMSREFEVKKRKIAYEGAGRIVVRLPLALAQILKRKTNKDLAEVLKDKGYTGKVETKGDKIHIQCEFFRTFFKTSVTSIIRHVRNILSDPISQDPPVILMVGGFSESELVQEEMKRAFPDKKFVIPVEAGMAVLKGAVMFGHKPSVIEARISKYTYGINFHVPFEKHIHPKAKMVTMAGNCLCKDTFKKFVTVGETVEVGDMRVHTFEDTFATKERKRMTEYCNIYITEEANPEYVDDGGCRMLGQVAMLPPSGQWPDQIEGRVVMSFGATEFEVIVYDESNGIEFKTKFDFLQ